VAAFVRGMVSADIGCGMETVKLAEKEIGCAALDRLIRREIPSGRDVRKTPHTLNSEINPEDLRCADKINIHCVPHCLGTLGGGNHFIEIDRNDNGDLYLIVHSGSRHLRVEIADYYQCEANKTLCGNSEQKIKNVIAELKSKCREKEISETIKRQKTKQIFNLTQYRKTLLFTRDNCLTITFAICELHSVSPH
jgi:RNA-splicing ligase RtcB